MFIHNKDTSLSNKKKEKRKTWHCDLKGQDDIICDYEQYDISIIFKQIVILSSSQHLDLVGKVLCWKYYNKLIVNAKKKSKTHIYSYLKHESYI